MGTMVWTHLSCPMDAWSLTPNTVCVKERTPVVFLFEPGKQNVITGLDNTYNNCTGLDSTPMDKYMFFAMGLGPHYFSSGVGDSCEAGGGDMRVRVYVSNYCEQA